MSAALKSLEKLDLKGKMTIIGIAKKLEEIYYPNDSLPMYLDKKSETLRIVQQMRDEAHRFAFSYHHQIKQKNDLHSILDDIPDVGETRRKILLKHFGSSKQIKDAALEELQKVPGIGKDLADKIYSHLRNENRE